MLIENLIGLLNIEKLLLKNMLNALIKHEQIETTLPKAKELKVAIDKIITLGKKNTLASKRILISKLQDQSIVKKNNYNTFKEI